MSPLERAGEAADPACLQDLYENAPCGYLSTAPDGTIVMVNETFLAWTGFASTEVIGRPFAELLTVGSRLFYDTRCLPVLRLKGEVREVALVLRIADGGELPILVNSTVKAGPDGRPAVMRTAVFDASARQDYERDLLAARRAAERSEVRVRVLQEASARFGAGRSEGSLTVAIADIARSAFDATVTTVMLLDGDGVLQAAAGTPHPLGGPGGAPAWGPEVEALRTGRVLVVGSVDEAELRFPALADPLSDARLSAMTVTPLIEEAVALGVLVCFFGRRREFDQDEIALHEALGRQAGQALQRIRLEEQLRHLALHDKLTGLANREVLQARLAQVLAAAARSGQPLAVLFLDLDGFKAINDRLGHAIGDSVLVQVASRLRSQVRDSDTVARFGGDEFIVVCEDVNALVAVQLAERIRLSVRQPLADVPAELPLTASIGIARHRPGQGPGPQADALLLAADTAMYRSKEGGKDRHTAVDL